MSLVKYTIYLVDFEMIMFYNANFGNPFLFEE